MAFEHFVQSGTKQLRCGYTTGTCAALAAEGATQLLLTGTAPKTLSVRTPKGWTVEVVPEVCEKTEDGTARCAVRKDAGDDPDVTDGMPVVATVSIREPSSEAVVIDGGDGVGRVTKPGLDQPVGNAAINRVPRQMIRDAVLDVCEELDYDPVTKGAVQVVISIPGGEERAKKTFNPKLGVEGGLSVLGTSGIVEPMSEQALKDTIAVELRQAFELQKQAGVPRPAVLLTPGNYGKDFLDAQGWSDLAVPVVKISNYVGDALDAAVSIGFEDILLAGHIGKLVKVAGNIMNTHSSVAD
ncbi:MAG: cobalt-precorrin-5B (C(1))-methyltransferase CbiD, partial [Acutalibacteraceae bacterium]|nr:cobalt-precorrin-5B (C(1))-methyltransferase CbiD [Acutalibacteraceae bacterium]